jgi:hypothetical protein
MANPTGYRLPLHDFPGGAANSTGAITTDVASSVMAWRSYTACSATSGGSYGARVQHYVTGAAGSGAALRAYALVKGVTAGTLYGLEATAEIMSTTSSAISGQAAAVKATMGLNLDSTGTNCAVLAEYSTASGKAAGALSDSFFRAVNVGAGSATGCHNLFSLGDAKATTDGSKLSSTNHDTISADTYIRILIAGTPHWLLATTHLPAGS